MIFYATFGFSQSLSGSFVKLDVEDYGEARRVMVEHYGTMWAFMYPEEDFDRCIARYGLVEVPLGTKNERLADD